MKTQDNQDYELASSKTFPNSATSRGRFRFPFRQKPVISMSSPPTNSSTSGSAGTPSANAYNLFGFRKIGTPKHQSATPRKSVSFSAMDWKRKISSDHTDVAYREAVTRLRSILSPRPHGLLDSSSMKGSQGDVSKSFDSGPVSPPTSRRDRFNIRSIFSSKESPTKPQQQLNNQLYSYIPSTVQQSGCEDDLIDFINKQGEYIAQLEKETKYCRDDLANMLGKVREVICENEALHERQKRDILNNMIEQLDEKTDGYDSIGEKYGGGSVGKKPSIKKSSSSNLILESKITEMEAQLSQSKRSLQLAQEEILELRKNRLHSMDQDLSSSLVPSSVNPYAHCDLHRAEIENLNREKQNLVETLSKFKTMMGELRDRESDAARKVKNSLDIVETMQHEKAQSDMESRRLKDELERREQRLRELVSENCKKIHEEKMQMEMKYRQEIDMLNSNINVEMDALTRAKLELERMKRNEIELRRELQLKTQTMEDLRQENLIRMGHMQSELSQALLMKSQAEQDLINSRLLIEKVERDGKQEAAKLQAEITGLRQRMEASDNDLIEAQELIVKLNETIGHLQRETSILKSRDGGSEDQDVFHVIQHMEDKHSKEMTELEQLIQAQNGLVEKLSTECKMLTDKLDDTSKQYRQDLMVELQSCVSNLPGYKKENVSENENEKDNDNEKSSPRPSIDIDQEKIKGLLSELNVIVQEMSQWVEKHPASTGDEEDSDEDEDEDEDEEESEEEDDDEEDGEGKEKAEGETEKSEIENDEKKSKDGGKKKEKVKKSAKKEDGDDDDEDDEDDDNEDEDEDEEGKSKVKEGEDKTDEESKEKEKSLEKKNSVEGANVEETPEKEVEESDKTEEVKEKSEVKEEEVPSSSEKEEEKPESAKKEVTKEITENNEIAMIKVLEVNNQIEEWIKKIQDVVKRFSNSFPSKVAC